MKVDVDLIVPKNQDAAGEGPPRTPQVSPEGNSGMVLLIYQKNQQARRLDPASLTEARPLLLEVSRRLSGGSGETLTQVHLLKSRGFVRLP